MTKYILRDIYQGTRQTKCDACGRGVRTSVEIIENTETGEIQHLGIGCAFNLTGIKPTDRIVPVEVEPTDAERAESLTFMLSWMNGE